MHRNGMASGGETTYIKIILLTCCGVCLPLESPLRYWFSLETNSENISCSVNKIFDKIII